MTILTQVIVPALRHDLVRRQRLLDMLYQSLDFKLTLVTAAAGYGKTSLLVDFAHDTELPVCWLTLDQDDRDPGQFLTNIVASVAQQFKDFGQATMTALANGSSAQDAVGALVNELITTVPDLFVLVLDDYHQADVPQVAAVMDRLLRFLPDHVRIILSGRRLPAVNLIHLTAKREMTALVPRELCFTAGETAQLLQKYYNLPIQVADADVISRKMDGWVTGIILASQQFTRQFAMQLQPANGELDVVYVYLTSEVLSMQSPHIRDFLLQTSILRWMTVEICNELLHRNDAAEALTTLESQHLFVERVDESDGMRYRYHPLFQEFLFKQLALWDADRIDSLHREAAHIYSRVGDKQEAIRHWLAAGAVDEATSLIDVLAPSMFASGRCVTLLDWREQLGAQAVHAPSLQLHVAKVFTDRGEYNAALELLDSMLTHPAGLRENYHARVQQSYIWYLQGRPRQTIESLLPLIENNLNSKEKAYALRVLGLCNQQLGDPRQAQKFLLESLSLYQGLNDRFNQGQVLLGLVLTLSPTGEIDQVFHYQNQALEILRQLGNPIPLAAALNNSAYTHHRLGNLAKADKLYQEALANISKSAQPRTEAAIILGRADLLRDTGQLEAAKVLYHRSLDVLSSVHEPWLQDYAFVGLATCNRLTNDLDQALAWVRQATLSADAGMEAAALVEEGAILAQLDRDQDAQRQLDEGLAAWQRQGAFAEVAIAELWLAELHRQAGREHETEEALTRSLAAAKRCSAGDVRFALEAHNHPSLLAYAERHTLNPPQLGHLRQHIHNLQTASAHFTRNAASVSTGENMLQIFALGDGRVIRRGSELASADWSRLTSRVLFFFIADRPKVQRNEVIGQFWPEVPDNKATARLQTALYNARKAVGAPMLLYLPDEASYQLDSSLGVWYDVAEFEESLHRAAKLSPGQTKAHHLRRAIDLYSGPYLADIDEDWVIERRRVLEIAFLEAVIELGDCYYAEQDYPAAERWYGEALELDNYREDVHRRLIRTLAQDGRRAEALRQYDHCVNILREELAVEPDPATQILVNQIRSS